MRDGKIIVARLWPGFGGGVESYTPVILGIKPEKYETIFIHLTKNSDNPNIFEQKGKKVFYITEKPQLPFFRPLVFLKLANLLRNEGVDILHCHKHKSTVYGTIAGKLAGVPIILAHVHGLGRTRNFSRKMFNRFILSHVDKILTVGQAVKDDVLRNNPSVKPEKVINVGNSIDLNYFSSAVYDKQTIRGKFGIPQNSFVFAAAGRLAPTKGQQYLISAYSRIRKQLPNAQLLIAGTGELGNELGNQVLSLGCESSIHFLGNVANMSEFYSTVDVFVLPSIAEGLPRTLIEAIGSGVLCIASDVGGIPEILDNGRCGILVPPKDEFALAEAMLKSANMPQQEKLSVISTAKNYIRENYSHNAAIKRIEKIYDSLVTEKNVQKVFKSNKFSIQEKK